MRFLAAEKLSEHKYKTPEGYLVCVDAVLSRTGKQKYIRSELFGDSCKNPTDEVEVDRLESDVFDEKAMASFENKPICIEHPDEDVNVVNHNDLSVGFVRDIKRGTDNGKPVMLGTLVITDENAIDLVESGEYAELSCGYDCDITDDEHPTQRNIRGNHVALCKQGRAGIARIVDSVKITDNDIEWLRALDRHGIKFSFVNGGYGMKFNSNADYIIAKRLANQYKMKNGYWDDNARIYSDYRSTTISQDDSVNDLTFNRMTEEAKKLKEELGMYARQAGSHKSTGVVPYKTRQSGPQVKELNEAINEAIQQLQNGVRDKSAWNRLAIKLEAWEDDPEMTSVAKRAAKAIRKFEAFIGDSDMKDIQSTKAPGTDEIIYVMQSDIDKINSLLAKSSINKRFEVKDMATLKDDEYVQLPRGRFKLVVKTKEELEKEGYGYHHSDNGYSVYVKNNNAVAIKDDVNENEIRNLLNKAGYTPLKWYRGGAGVEFEIRKGAFGNDDAVKLLKKHGYDAETTGLTGVIVYDSVKKDSIKDAAQANDANYEQWTKQGWRVVALYKDGGRVHAIVERKSGDFVVALGYNTSTGEWAQGRYVSTFAAAVDTLNEEKPGAVPIRDAKTTKKTFEVSFVKDGVTYIRKVKADDLQDAIREAADERFSPMTYKKLKELGVSQRQWSGWTQEQANEYIRKHSETNQSTAKQKKQPSASVEELFDKKSLDKATKIIRRMGAPYDSDVQDALDELKINAEAWEEDRDRVSVSSDSKDDIIKAATFFKSLGYKFRVSSYEDDDGASYEFVLK